MLYMQYSIYTVPYILIAYLFHTQKFVPIPPESFSPLVITSFFYKYGSVLLYSFICVIF